MRGRRWRASGALPENVNYRVKSSLLLSFSNRAGCGRQAQAPSLADGHSEVEDVVKSAQDAAVLVLVYK